MTDTIDLFDEPKSFPDPTAQRRYRSLVGLDEMKETAVREHFDKFFVEIIDLLFCGLAIEAAELA